jgi:hypothetical protein
VRLTREGDRFKVERLIECSFVPLVRGLRIPSERLRGQPAAEGEARG